MSQPNQFIKRGTPQFMRVTLALFSAGLQHFHFPIRLLYTSEAADEAKNVEPRWRRYHKKKKKKAIRVIHINRTQHKEQT
ncbi:hypothetical protein NMT57_24665, partial [Escherichia coli]|nr:hypothetical protein [Escherichia coli]